MGSEFPPRRVDDGSVHVLVTGFGAFSRHKVNPSWLVAQSLPDTIPKTKEGDRKIRIHVRPQPIKVAYRTVREEIPPLVFCEREGEVNGHAPNFDIVLHMGVSYVETYYEMETRAFRDDYYKTDVDGKSKPEGYPSWRDEMAPKMLKTGFDSEAILESWKKGIPDADVRISTDAGRFICEYIFFASLLEYHRYRESQPAPVTFLHVPVGIEEKQIAKGKNVAISLIQALVQNRPGM